MSLDIRKAENQLRDPDDCGCWSMAPGPLRVQFGWTPYRWP